jgi:5-methylcytosine-specific restriction protein B
MSSPNTNLHELKEQFLEAWPQEKVEQMTLEEYTNLNKEDSFTYWIEFRTQELGGIGAGPSFKFGIYERRNTESELSAAAYQTDGQYAWYAKLGNTAVEAFLEVKKRVLEVIRAAKNAELAKIDDIDWATTVKWKIAFLYSDYRLLNFFKREGLEYLAEQMGIEQAGQVPFSELNQLVLSQKPEDKDYYEFAKEMWDQWDERNETNDKDDIVSFEQIKSLFSEKDLEVYFTYLKSFIEELGLNRGDKRIVLTTKRNRLNFVIGQRYCWNLFFKHKEGKFGFISLDPLFNHSEMYDGNPPQPYYTHVKDFNPTRAHLDSIIKGMKHELDRTSKSGYLKYHNHQFEDYIFSDESNINPTVLSNHNLNTILYGPPGTGKTYLTTDLAVKIIKPEEFVEGDHAHNKTIFDELVKQEKVVFTTFHQSTSYEDFIEGIKPVMSEGETEDERGDIQYEIQNGVFKQLIEKIDDRRKMLQEEENYDFYIPKEKFGRQVNKVSLGDSTVEQDQAIYDYCMENNCVAIGFGEDIDFTGAQKLSEIRDRFKQAGIEVDSASDFNVTAVNRLINWMEPGQLVLVPNGNKKIRAIGEVSGGYYCDPDAPIRYSQFRKVKWLYKNIDIPVKEVYPRRFSQMTIYHMNGSEFNTEYFSRNGSPVDYDEKFVMIIDEINRGNIAQIFGELITLLEEDKRDGEANALSVKLPYSKTRFSIPPNLYLIGTMNTADRSVEALDTALRRRFSFEEMMPQPAVIQDVLGDKNVWKGIRISEVLATINKRIEILVDRDHLIGHSYFLALKEVAPENMEDALIHIFVDKIIPLLQEYFYNDYVKIGMVLGKGFIRIKETPRLNFADFEESLDADYTDKTIYHIYSRQELKQLGLKVALQQLLNQSREQ